jgi:Lrp/AsnC family leucine-responsive transcriptional regulator
VLDARRLGKDITAFIGITSAHASLIEAVEHAIASHPDVLEIHHVTGVYTFLVKVKTNDTACLETLLRTIRAIDGVERSETMVVLSTHTERWTIPLLPPEPAVSGAPNRTRSRARQASGNSTPRARS